MHSEFEKFWIMISGMNGNRVNVSTGLWTQEQDDVVRERRAEKAPWRDISAEIKQTFGIRRTTKALQARFDSVIRKQHAEDMSLRSKVSWTAEQMDWLKGECHGKKNGNWNDLAAQFKMRFGVHRNGNSLGSKFNRMLASQNTTDKNKAVSQSQTRKAEQDI